MSNSENSDEGNFDPRKFNPAEFQAFMKKYLEDPDSFETAELAKAAGIPTNPEQLQQLFDMISTSIGRTGESEGVDWSVALNQAKTIARQHNQAVSELARSEWLDSLNIANLWLDQATEVATVTADPKFLTRDLWVEDAMPLFKAISEPVANRLATALSNHMAKNSPVELEGLMAEAGRLLRHAGGGMFAIQLGQSIGKLSERVLAGGDIGLPIFAEQRPAFVPQNLAEYISELGVPAQEARLYLAVRELAHARLFKHSRWLRESVVSQIVAYASDLTIDEERIMTAVAETDITNPDAMRSLLESGSMLADRTAEQQRALESIETVLALIEGWVDAVTQEATRLLPEATRIGEAVRRRRAAGGPAELTFGTLIGLELRPKKVREATAMWLLTGQSLGAATRDSLWDHPDMLPSMPEIEDPGKLLARLRGDGDDFDSELKNLLDS
ncbi:MAG: zinc-dependent metalloprotease [Micrococcales bacterium]